MYTSFTTETIDSYNAKVTGRDRKKGEVMLDGSGIWRGHVILFKVKMVVSDECNG
jgi:hypothetical protein